MSIEQEYLILIKNIKKNWKINNLTQEELAEKTDLSSSYIKQIESSRDFKNITLNTLFKIAKALNVETKDLFTKNNTKVGV